MIEGSGLGVECDAGVFVIACAGELWLNIGVVVIDQRFLFDDIVGSIIEFIFALLEPLNHAFDKSFPLDIIGLGSVGEVDVNQVGCIAGNQSISAVRVGGVAVERIKCGSLKRGTEPRFQGDVGIGEIGLQCAVRPVGDIIGNGRTIAADECFSDCAPGHGMLCRSCRRRG